MTTPRQFISLKSPSFSSEADKIFIISILRIGET